MFVSRRVGRIFGDQGGASAVEFAIVGPILILILIGIFSVGFAMYRISSLRLVLEQSGRALQLNPTMSQSQLATMIKAGLNTEADPDVTVSLTTVTTSGVKVAQVSATYAFNLSIPMVHDYAINYQTAVSVPLP